MPKGKYKRLQTCLECGRPGHNRRRCGILQAAGIVVAKELSPLGSSVQSAKKLASTVSKRSIKKQGFSATESASQKAPSRIHGISVHTHGDRIASSYIVNLKSDTHTVRHANVAAFREAYRTLAPRVDVDFASLIRAANNRGSIVAASARLASRTHAPFFSRLVFHITAIGQSCAHSMGRIAAAPGLFFAAFLILLIALPFPAFGYYQQVHADAARVIDASTRAFSSLESSTLAAFAADLPRAETDLSHALEQFTNATTILEHDRKFLATIAEMIPFFGSRVQGGKALIQAGHHVALGNAYLVKGIEAMRTTDGAPTDDINIFGTHLRAAVPQYQAALDRLAAIDADILPEAYRTSFYEFRILFAAFVNDVSDVSGLIGVLSEAFGSKDFRRYLILFQNNHERRPAGGFAGSFALIDVQRGKIVGIEVPTGGTYDVQGQLSAYLEAPAPLQMINPRWEFQDANWFFDFSESAKKAAWFLEESWGTGVDGVIAVNATVIERILGVIGPIEEIESGLSFDAETAIQEIQKEVDSKEDAEGPKKVIGALLQTLLDASAEISPLDALRLLIETNTALTQKEIQIFFRDTNLHDRVAEFGWTGEVAHTEPGEDYLGVVVANVGGEKSDARVNQHIQHEVSVEPDGRVIDRVTVTRTHTATTTERLYGVPNISYVRAYVPDGSVLLDAGGFSYPEESLFHAPETWYDTDSDLARIEAEEGVHIETGTRVTKEFGKTAFGNWMIVPPGETREIFFVYELPFRAFAEETRGSSVLSGVQSLFDGAFSRVSRYRLYVQKQSGANDDFESTVIYPDGWQPRFVSEDSMQMHQNGATLETTLTTDVGYGVVMEEE